jgi:NADPH:quinone reductase-like Zn-dependent oxidoreductase
MAGGKGKQLTEAIVFGPLVSRRGGQTVTSFVASPSADDLAFVAGLLEAGKVVPVIERTYPLEETAEAVRYVGAGHAAGKVVISIQTE